MQRLEKHQSLLTVINLKRRICIIPMFTSFFTSGKLPIKKKKLAKDVKNKDTSEQKFISYFCKYFFR